MTCRNTVADFAAKGQQHRWKRRIQKRQALGARERTRTSTTLRSLAPEASASASSATRARVKRVGPDEPTRLTRHFQFCPRAFALSTRGQVRTKRFKLRNMRRTTMVLGALDPN